MAQMLACIPLGEIQGRNVSKIVCMRKIVARSASQGRTHSAMFGTMMKLEFLYPVARRGF